VSNTESTDAKRAKLAEAFDQDLDPLAEYAPTFEQTDVDPFELFYTEVLSTRDVVESTRRDYHRLFKQWREHMLEQGRHPVCPSECHVKDFIRYLLEERGNHPDTVKEKVRKLNDAYGYWQEDPTFPHPPDYNPVNLAKSKMTLASPEAKEPPRIPKEELRKVLSNVTHVRNRALILIQLKLGLRATEVCNIKISEISLTNTILQNHYNELGTDPMVVERENAVSIPHGRKGNKSRRTRVLPLDDELQRVLLDYLLMRPDNGQPWLFLSLTTHEQPEKQILNYVWKDAFHPEYAETEEHRAVTSHYGRHFFTTFWRVEQDLNRELVKYMRGDTPGSATIDERGMIDEYIHTYYEDIRDVYLENIYKLGF
jgi:integrase/recombinase XerD